MTFSDKGQTAKIKTIKYCYSATFTSPAIMVSYAELYRMLDHVIIYCNKNVSPN